MHVCTLANDAATPRHRLCLACQPRRIDGSSLWDDDEMTMEEEKSTDIWSSCGDFIRGVVFPVSMHVSACRKTPHGPACSTGASRVGRETGERGMSLPTCTKVLVLRCT